MKWTHIARIVLPVTVSHKTPLIQSSLCVLCFFMQRHSMLWRKKCSNGSIVLNKQLLPGLKIKTLY